mgnify:CR=1 FL=1
MMFEIRSEVEPIFVLKDNVLVGFKEDNWLENVSKK